MPERCTESKHLAVVFGFVSLLVAATASSAPIYSVQEIIVRDAVKAVGPNASGEVAVRSGFVIGRSSRGGPGPGGTARDLGFLSGGNHFTAHAINDAGAVAGSANIRSSVRAAIGVRNVVLEDIGVLPGDSGSEAFGINNAGTAVGYSSGRTGVRAFAWSRARAACRHFRAHLAPAGAGPAPSMTRG